MGKPKITAKKHAVRESDAVKQAFHICYEISPGRFFVVTDLFRSADHLVRSKLLQAAIDKIEPQIFRKLRIETSKTTVGVGGWQGVVNPSAQVMLAENTPIKSVKACMAALGLVWRQDAVVASRLHPDGSKVAAIIRKADLTDFTVAELVNVYSSLYAVDVKKLATIGFSQIQGAMVFINGGGLTDVQFKRTITTLVQKTVAGDIRLLYAKADLVIIETDWSKDHGENYRDAIREAGRSDLLDWLDNNASREAKAFIEGSSVEGEET